MTTLEIKKKSIQHTLEDIQDERLLEAVNNILLESLDSEIIGYVGTTPLTKADLIRKALQAEEDIKKGRVHSIEDVKKNLTSLKK